ncbi:MAG TPA: phosphatase PAP2 family protein [Phycisphaerae bacterium]|nr:phosphatase PAP2 family protein [Phycisphaerae bacterium]
MHANILHSLIVGLSVIVFVGHGAVFAGEPSGSWAERARAIAEMRLAASRMKMPETFSLDRGPSVGGLPLRAANVQEVESFSLAADQATTAPAAAPGAQSAVSEQPPIERGPLPGFGDTILRDLKEAPRVLWHDTKKVFGNPWNVVFLLGAGGASLALRPEVDDDIEDYYDKHHTFKPDWRDAFGAAGNPAVHFGFALAWYALGQTAQDATTYEVGKRAISALGITGATTMLLKLAANTDSPNGEPWAWPSGHVSSTMALATVLNDAYGPLVGIPMFGLTGLVAVERLDSGEHHFSDVIFGAALGWVVAETIMKEHQPEIFGGRVVPYADPAGRNAGVAWVKALGN